MSILKGVDCDYIYETINEYGVDEPYCRKRIYDIACSECTYNRLGKKYQGKYKYIIDKFNEVE